jgi:hypothetical protein
VKSPALPRVLPDDLVAHAALDYHRQELERLRATLHPANLPAAIDRNLVQFLVLAALFFWTTGWLAFWRAAARREVRIERLKTLKAE